MSVHSTQGPQASSGTVPSAQERLDSWKEIAAYLRRDERTVRRWEKAQGMPVHRHPHSKQSSVYAYRAELDAWWNNGHERLAAMTAAESAAGEISKPNRMWLWIVSLAVIAVAGSVTWLANRPQGAAESLRGAAERGIVVLPLRNISGNADLDYLGMGVSGLIADRLSYVSQRTIGPRTVLSTFGEEVVNIAGVGERLRAGVLVGGIYTNTSDPGRLRFTLQLRKAPEGEVVWEKAIDTNLPGTAGLGDLVAEQVWPERKLPEARGSKAEADGPAYERVLRGISAGPKDLASGVRDYEAALKLKPDLAAARTQLAFAYLIQTYGIAADKTKEEAGARMVRDAIEDNAASPAILSEAGLLLMELGRLEEATTALQSAVRANPKHGEARLWLSQAYRYGGALEESRRELETAMDLNPHLREVSTPNVYLYLGQAEQFLQGMPQDIVTARTTFYRGLALLYQGNAAQAEGEFAKASRIEPGQLHARYGEVFRLAIRGEREAGLKLLGQLARQPLPDGEMQYKIAQGFAMLRDTPSAMQFLHQAAEAGFTCHTCFVRDPLLKSLKDQPDFPPFLATVQQKQESFRRKFFP